MAETGKLFLVVAADNDATKGVKLDMWINPDRGFTFEAEHPYDSNVWDTHI